MTHPTLDRREPGQFSNLCQHFMSVRKTPVKRQRFARFGIFGLSPPPSVPPRTGMPFSAAATESSSYCHRLPMCRPNPGSHQQSISTCLGHYPAIRRVTRYPLYFSGLKLPAPASTRDTTQSCILDEHYVASRSAPRTLSETFRLLRGLALRPLH